MLSNGICSNEEKIKSLREARISLAQLLNFLFLSRLLLYESYRDKIDHKTFLGRICHLATI